MTREKAIEIEKKKLNKFKFNELNLILAEANVDALIEMEVLIVSDPPSSRIDMAITQLCYDSNFSHGGIDGKRQVIERWLNACGLKLVEI